MARLPSEIVDVIETSSPGFTELQLELESAYIDSLLSKRYLVPFVLSAPLVVMRWLVDLVSLQVWLKRGFDGTQVDAQIYIDAATHAREDLRQAADAKDGLFELPLRADVPSAGGKPTIHSYSETSPFLGQRIQRVRGRAEDYQGTGTRRP